MTADDFMAAMGRPLTPSADRPPTETAPPPATVEPAKPARRRHVAPPAPKPPPGLFTMLKDDVPCISIPLHGEHGEGRRAILDLLQWDRVRLLAGDDWNVRATDSGLSVVSYRLQARRLAGARDGSAAFLVLSRFVAAAKEGEVVSFLDDDPFHIRRRNLVVEVRREYWDAHRVRTGRSGGASAETPATT